MNVIVSNRQKDIIDNANIDAIKDLNGLFNVEDLINKFKNYYFSRMILDATSIVNFASKEVLTTLVDEIGADKLIILLPANPEPPLEFRKLLIDLKIYNFTNNIEDVVKFIDKPNTYEDVIGTIQDSSNSMYVDNSIKEDDEYQEENVNSDMQSNNNYGNNNNYVDDSFQHRSLGDMLNSFNPNSTYDTNNKEKEDTDMDNNDNEEIPEESIDSSENIVDDDINSEHNEYEEYNNMIQSDEGSKDETESNESNEEKFDNKNVFLIYDNIDDNSKSNAKKDKIVIGVKDVTIHAGSTSLVYMLQMTATNKLNLNALSIEIDKNDFRLFRDNKMISVDSKDIKNVIENSREDVIFIDLNECGDTDFCTDVLYLVEPSVIKLNKLMIENKNIFKELKDKKVVINKSLLSDNDIRTLSSEAGIDFFYTIEPLNDREMNDSIINLIEKLNIK